MAFGFDPRLILAGQQYTGPDPHETMRSLAQLAQVRQGMDIRQAERQRAQSLADIFRANAGSPDGVGRALMQAGFGSEALEWGDKQAEIAGRQATRENVFSQIVQRGKQELGAALYGTKDQAEYEQRLSAAPPQWRQFLPPTWEQAKPLVEAWAIPPEKRAEMEHKAETLAETKRRNRELEAIARKNAESYGKRSGKTGTTGEGSGKQLPSTVLSELADIETAEAQVDEIFAKADEENVQGLGARANQFVTDALGLQGTDAARFEGAAAPVRQGVGKILEGGKLAAGDEGKYKNMLPKYGDSKAVRDEKKKSLKNYLRKLKTERTGALKAGGYAVPDTKPVGGRFQNPKTGEIWELSDPEEIEEAARNKWVHLR